MIFDIDKISIKEAINNENGRTSSKKLIGVTASTLCLLLMIALVIFYFFHTGESTIILELVDKIIVVFGIASGLLGVTSISNAISRRYV